MSPLLQSKEMNAVEGENDTSRLYSHTSACFQNEALNEQDYSFENSQPASEVESNERMTRHGHLHGQSQSSLFSDSFRLEV